MKSIDEKNSDNSWTVKCECYLSEAVYKHLIKDTDKRTTLEIGTHFIDFQQLTLVKQ